ncbi:nucleotide exchange factor GrpE [Rhodococcus sp. IEGM 1401]|uniref:nucleotide exchange factor GrpE n=1 Tax=unclassified Rhodococcus (in: high G+C Gram-positive bacteria) TaxID=192944 RepID=UPI0011F03209|nr:MULTISPECIES: nucleotide exchange factor GrpE [unclassified Rhodococcus (in: high G+C Gram-positive bacteria)]KAA0923446.1 nucleotide exchange factor GrpE [Rhodococcus sp. ANT_H53B]MCZ4561430.1 nucleotide exchange factor GrpE [Rhodococcus sp. IEGM 1401]MDI9921690.1 nucleotide exchange factor GrpE [Rhodococcus sp. IEGM 1372]MDV8034142.1 nucleotide exchange factor GrpE [Rhodococcus sp. IEGM 1414]MDV8077725.1 nucleotide exchange factor GrpE [Rhodococcus sp. IEGM 1370]
MTSDNTEQEPVTFVDKRKIDPETGEVREGDAVPEPLVGTGAAPQPDSVDEGTVDGDVVEDPRDTQVAELTADLQRVSAEYANYRRRTDREKQTGAENAKASVVSQLLPVLDDLERARQHGDLETGPLKAVADKLAVVFSNIGLTTFGAEGDAFDPAIHEAVSHEGDGSSPVVGTLMRPGYKLGERVLRTAMVGVVDSATQESDAPASDEQ